MTQCDYELRQCLRDHSVRRLGLGRMRYNHEIHNGQGYHCTRRTRSPLHSNSVDSCTILSRTIRLELWHVRDYGRATGIARAHRQHKTATPLCVPGLHRRKVYGIGGGPLSTSSYDPCTSRTWCLLVLFDCGRFRQGTTLRTCMPSFLPSERLGYVCELRYLQSDTVYCNIDAFMQLSSRITIVCISCTRRCWTTCRRS